MRKIKKNWIGFLLINIIIITPIVLLSACVSKEEEEQGRENETRENLLKDIKIYISEAFQENVLVIDALFFKHIPNDQIFDILRIEKQKMLEKQLDNIDITSSEIAPTFIKNINEELINLNDRLKKKYTQLENMDKSIVEIKDSKLILENVDYDSLMELYGKITNNQENAFSSSFKMVEEKEKIYKVLLKLEFNINIIDNITSSYTLHDLNYYVTTNKKDVNDALSQVAEFLAQKLVNIKIDLADLTDSTTDGYMLSDSKLEQKLINLVKTSLNLNSEVKLDIEKIIFDNNDTRFSLPSLKHSDDQGKYYKKFIVRFLYNKQNMVDEFLTNNPIIKKLNKNEEYKDTINIKEFKYTILSWKLDNIIIPAREINTYIKIQKLNFKEYLEDFRQFFKVYFEMSEAGKVDKTFDGLWKKVMKIDYPSLKLKNWSYTPDKALWDYYNDVLRNQINDNNKRYFQMDFNQYGQPKHYNDHHCYSIHWDKDLVLIFKFKIFEIKFLDQEGLKFTNVCKV